MCGRGCKREPPLPCSHRQWHGRPIAPHLALRDTQQGLRYALSKACDAPTAHDMSRSRPAVDRASLQHMESDLCICNSVQQGSTLTAVWTVCGWGGSLARCVLCHAERGSTNEQNHEWPSLCLLRRDKFGDLRQDTVRRQEIEEGSIILLRLSVPIQQMRSLRIDIDAVCVATWENIPDGDLMMGVTLGVTAPGSQVSIVQGLHRV